MKLFINRMELLEQVLNAARCIATYRGQDEVLIQVLNPATEKKKQAANPPKFLQTPAQTVASDKKASNSLQPPPLLLTPQSLGSEQSGANASLDIKINMPRFIYSKYNQIKTRVLSYLKQVIRSVIVHTQLSSAPLSAARHFSQLATPQSGPCNSGPGRSLLPLMDDGPLPPQKSFLIICNAAIYNTAFGLRCHPPLWQMRGTCSLWKVEHPKAARQYVNSIISVYMQFLKNTANEQIIHIICTDFYGFRNEWELLRNQHDAMFQIEESNWAQRSSHEENAAHPVSKHSREADRAPAAQPCYCWLVERHCPMSRVRGLGEGATVAGGAIVI